MAKVRIQARSADKEDAEVHHYENPEPHHFHHEKHKHVGALEILGRVWKREGFFGWYQVRALPLQLTETCSRLRL